MHRSLWSWAIAALLLVGRVGELAAQTVPSGAGVPSPSPWKNLQVLTQDVDMGEVMAQFDTALGVQCTYCHVAGDFASDANPKKAIARKMLQMGKTTINPHFPDAGNAFLQLKYLPFPEGKQYVTCYTCHRGAVTPVSSPERWYGPVPKAPEPGMARLSRAEMAARMKSAGPISPILVTTMKVELAHLKPSDPGYIPPVRGYHGDENKNMQVLPPDTNSEFVMDSIRTALGVECNFCHVSGTNHDRAADLNPHKLIARDMMRMDEQINAALFPGQDVNIILMAASTPPAGTHWVTCYMCHRGNRLPLAGPADHDSPGH